MMSAMESRVKRHYDASKRREAAARTRQAILDAALTLFGDRGYSATPMSAIAEQAGVALDTVYSSAGRKPELVRLLIETAISGRSQAFAAEDRDYVQAILAAPDAMTKINIYAAAMRAIAGRWRPSCRSSSRPPRPNPSWPRSGARSATAGPRICCGS